MLPGISRPTSTPSRLPIPRERTQTSPATFLEKPDQLPAATVTVRFLSLAATSTTPISSCASRLSRNRGRRYSSMTQLTAAQKVTRTYDARNRLQALTFPDGRGSQTWIYTPDGLPATITTQNISGSGVVANAYSYNRRRLLAGESVVTDGLTSSIGYGYDPNGHLATHTYPVGGSVAYAPNALGQPTRVANYATGATYFPNGQLKQFNYGNGIVYSATQNGRGLMSRQTACAVTGSCATADRRLDLAYAYDKQGNVSQITDHRNGRQTRGMSYDAVDRLTQATSNMFGTASYSYDVLDNLVTVRTTGG